MVDQIGRVYKHKYAFIIAVFGATCMAIQFWFHESSVQSSKEIYRLFNADYPNHSRAFLWASANSWGILDYRLVSLFSGIIILCLFLILIALDSKKNEGKKPVASSLVVLTYFLVFWIFSLVFNPLVLYRPLNHIFAIGSSIICGASSHLLLIHDHLRKKRRTPQSNSSEGSKQELILKALELEHAEYRNVLQSLMWVLGFLTVGMIFATVLQYIFALPLEIALSNAFGGSLVDLVVLFLFSMVGFLVGIVYQLMFETHDIVDFVRQKIGELEKSKPKKED